MSHYIERLFLKTLFIRKPAEFALELSDFFKNPLLNSLDDPVNPSIAGFRSAKKNDLFVFLRMSQLQKALFVETHKHISSSACHFMNRNVPAGQKSCHFTALNRWLLFLHFFDQIRPGMKDDFCQPDIF